MTLFVFVEVHSVKTQKERPWLTVASALLGFIALEKRMYSHYPVRRGTTLIAERQSASRVNLAITVTRMPPVSASWKTTECAPLAWSAPRE